MCTRCTAKWYRFYEVAFSMQYFVGYSIADCGVVNTLLDIV